MAVINDRIKHYRLSLGLTLREVADAIGVKEATMQRYESGKIKIINYDTVVELAEVFKVHPAHLMGWDAEEGPSQVIPLTKSIHGWADPLVTAYTAARRPIREATCSVLQIPYVEPDEEPEPEIVPTAIFPSAAGIPAWIGNDEMEDKEYPPGVVPSGTSFAIRISGDSMEPTIPNGAYVFVKQQPDINSREIGVFMLYDEAVCKRYYKDKNSIKLLSDNPKYDPIIMEKDAEGFGLVGKVLGHYMPE